MPFGGCPWVVFRPWLTAVVPPGSRPVSPRKTWSTSPKRPSERSGPLRPVRGILRYGRLLSPFFAGLLPEGHRLTVLKNAAKTSFDDELTLLLAVGADVPGDVQIVPSGKEPAEPESLADTSHPEKLDFSVLANSVDLHGLPGVQNKASASMLTTPLAMRGMRYLLKLDPAENPHLVVNEAAHLTGARALKIPVARSRIINDKYGLNGLPVERFDRVKGDGGTWQRLPLEDGRRSWACRLLQSMRLLRRRWATHWHGTAKPLSSPGATYPSVHLRLADRDRRPPRQEPLGPWKSRRRLFDGADLRRSLHLALRRRHAGAIGCRENQ